MLSEAPSMVSSLASHPKNSLITISAIMSLKCDAKEIQYSSLFYCCEW